MFMSELPKTTLFMLMSVDGKISTGIGTERDFDKDFPRIVEISDGLGQYYELEQETDLFSLNTGKVMAKVGWNEKKNDIEKLPVSFIIIDNKPHLTEQGVANLIKRTKRLYIVTTNRNHPARKNPSADIEVNYNEDGIDFERLFKDLKAEGVDNLTVQSGGELNALLMRKGLINRVSLVVAPVMVGGKDTPSLIDGPSFQTFTQLQWLSKLKLVKADVLKHSYLHLMYEVI